MVPMNKRFGELFLHSSKSFEENNSTEIAVFSKEIRQWYLMFIEENMDAQV